MVSISLIEKRAATKSGFYIREHPTPLCAWLREKERVRGRSAFHLSINVDCNFETPELNEGPNDMNMTKGFATLTALGYVFGAK